MRTISALLASSLLAVTAFAADLTLTDGRVLKDATITSQTTRNVTVKHAAGISSVAKTLLPPELKTKYPVDEAAAKLADEKDRQARLRAQELEQAEYQRSLKLQAKREETAKANERALIEEEANRRDLLNSARGEVQSRAEKYFKTEYPLVVSAKNVGSIKVTLTDLQLIEGWNNRWSVRGKCDIEYNGESVRVYPTYPPETVDAYSRAGRLKELSYAPYDTTRYSQKTQEFTAIYNAEASEPTFDLTLR